MYGKAIKVFRGALLASGLLVVFGYVFVLPAMVAAAEISTAPTAASAPLANTLRDNMANSVVMIRAVSQGYNYTTPWKKQGMQQGIGSGFIIKNNIILTNAHNVSNCRYVELRKQSMAKRYIASVAFIAHDCDLAILRVYDPGFFSGMQQLKLGGIPAENSTVQTYGFPMGGRHISVTEGVVSRVQMDIYAHSGADSHLVVQTDAAINPGNSGGPVMQNGKVVGVAFQGLSSADNIGYMIPTTVIHHFLTDIADGHYDGYGTLGVQSFPGLHSDSYRQYLKVPDGVDGMVVIATELNGPTEKILKPGDVISALGGYNVDNDGMVHLYGMRINMAEVIEQKQIGQPLQITFFRQGRKIVKTVKVAPEKPVVSIAKQYDKAPQYVVYAGLTFVDLSRNFMETWGGNWPTKIPFYMRYLLVNQQDLNKSPQRKRYVVLSEILPDAINTYCSPFKNHIVETINSQSIWQLSDVPRALAKPINGYCVIKFMDVSRPLVMRADKAAASQQKILQKYQVPVAQRLED